MTDYPSEATPLRDAPLEELEKRWHERVPESRYPVPPQTPFFLDGELVEDADRVEERKLRRLYTTPRIYDSRLVTSAYTEREPMVREAMAFQVTDDWHVRACFEDSAVSGTLFMRTGQNLTGGTLALQPDRIDWNLGDIGANDLIRSIHACRFAYSVFEHINFGGRELMINFRCDLPTLSADFDRKISSVINWGPKGPPF